MLRTSRIILKVAQYSMYNTTLCPSGLRGWTQVPLARAAWVQIPQVSFPCLCAVRMYAVVVSADHSTNHIVARCLVRWLVGLLFFNS